MIDIVVLISGNGSNLQAIIDASTKGYTDEQQNKKKLPVNIAAVISDKADAYGLKRATQAGIHTEVLKNSTFSSRDEYDMALQKLIDSYNPQLVVLAGFMRILGEKLVNHYLGRMLNIHPSLLPLFPGLNTHQKVLDSGQKTHGATVHFVTPQIDSGPVIIQAYIPVKENDTVETLKQRVHEQEHMIYPQAIQWFADKRLVFKDNMAFFNGIPIDQPQ